MEEFYEQYNGKDYGKFQEVMNAVEYGALLLAGVYILGLRAFFSGIIILLIYVAIVYFNRNKFVAYEYELTLDRLVVSKIMSEKRRKKLIDFALSDVETASNDVLNHKKCNNVKAYLNEGKNKQYLYVKTNEGLKCVALNMDEKMVSMCYRLKPMIFREIKK